MTYTGPGSLPLSVAMTLDSITARGVRSVFGCVKVSNATVIRPSEVFATASNCARIQSRAANTPRAVECRSSEKSLRVPNATSCVSIARRSLAETAATSARTRASSGGGETGANARSATAARRRRVFMLAVISRTGRGFLIGMSFGAQVPSEHDRRAATGRRVQAEDVGAAPHDRQAPSALVQRIGQMHVLKAIGGKARARIDDRGQDFVVLNLAAHLDHVVRARMLDGVRQRFTDGENELFQFLVAQLVAAGEG